MVFLQFGPECLAVDAEKLGGSAFIAELILENGLDVVFFNFFQASVFASHGAENGGAGADPVIHQIFKINAVPPGKDDGPLDCVFQLPNVSRPFVIRQSFDGLGRNRGYVFLGLPVVFLKEVVDQQRDVFFPFPERRQVDGDDA